MVVKLKIDIYIYIFFFSFCQWATVSLSIGERMNHNCEVNEIIAHITASLFATEFCMDIKMRPEEKLCLSTTLPQVAFFFLYVQTTLTCYLISR